MTIKFNTVKRGNPADSEYPKKYYPSIQSSGRISLRQLASRAAQMSTLTTTDMVAAIESLLTIIPDVIARAIFRYLRTQVPPQWYMLLPR